MNKQIFYTLLLIITFTIQAFGFVTYVPDSISTIQHAIDSVNANDTIIVSEGTYNENINFNGKSLTLVSRYFNDQRESHISKTIISGNDSGSVVIYNGGEDSTSILMGFTIKNGNADSTINYNGGGIYCNNSNPELSHLIVENNIADSCGGGIYFNNSDARCKNITLQNDSAKIFGGGIYLKNSTQIDSQITIQNNAAEEDGAGLYIDNSNLNLAKSYIIENSSNNSGGGFFINSSTVKFENCLIADNQIISGNGSAINGMNSSIEIVNNTIVNNNSSDEMYFNLSNLTSKNSIIWETINIDSDSANITYSNIKGGWSGTENLNVLPRFVSDNSDYHLSDSSYCIGMGTNDINFTTDIEGNVRPNPADSYTDIGAYENSRRAPINKGNIYYITKSGNETNGNGSYDRPFLKIQSGVDDASVGDTILILPGTYYEGVNVNKSLCIGSNILVTNDTTYIDNTIISVDSILDKSALQIENTGKNIVVINGLTLENGEGTNKYTNSRGGGIFCNNTNVQLKNLVIKNCTADYGAGLDFTNSDAVLSNVVIESNLTMGWGGGISSANSELYLFDVNILNNQASMGGGIYSIDNSVLNLQNVNILGNSAIKNVTLSPKLGSLYKASDIQSISNYGGGIHCQNTELTLQNTIVAKNESDGNGSGISLSESFVKSINSTYYGNSSSKNGGAFYLDYNSQAVIVNSILWQNSPQEIYLKSDSITITYSDIEGGESGIVDSGFVDWSAGNISSDPDFVDTTNNNYNLNIGSACENVGTDFFIFQGDTIIDLSEDEYSGNAPDFGAFGSNPNISDPTVNIKEIKNIVIPEKLEVFPAYPNPFNPTVTIPYAIPENGRVKISIYNILGQKVLSLVDEIQEKGNHKVLWNSENKYGVKISTGIYFVTIWVKYSSNELDFGSYKIVLIK
ncbi:MAG: T9SS type A sorting domain-containing protein [Candidatus Marinimicrobia bacterium]|nr:T9SS type A sorting domain-containing protein [Candidatus Neomarinimicrobiota bacterium]